MLLHYEPLSVLPSPAYHVRAEKCGATGRFPVRSAFDEGLQMAVHVKL